MQALVAKTLHWIGEAQDPKEMLRRMVQFEEKQYLFWTYTMEDLLAIEDQTIWAAVAAILASPFYENEKMKFLLTNDTYLGIMDRRNYHMEDCELWRRLDNLLGYIVAQMSYRAKTSVAITMTVPAKSLPYLTLVYLAKVRPVRYDYYSFWWETDQSFVRQNMQPLVYEVIQKLRSRVLPYSEENDAFAMTTEISHNVQGIIGRDYTHEFHDPTYLLNREN